MAIDLSLRTASPSDTKCALLDATKGIICGLSDLRGHECFYLVFDTVGKMCGRGKMESESYSVDVAAELKFAYHVFFRVF